MTLDRRQIIGALVAKNGIKLDEDDPAFLLVDLNILVLEAERGEAAKQLEAATAQFSEATTRNVDEVVSVTNEVLAQLSERVRELKSALEQRPQVAQQPAPVSVPQEGEKEPRSGMLWWLGPVLFCIGLLVGVGLTLAVGK